MTRDSHSSGEAREVLDASEVQELLEGLVVLDEEVPDAFRNQVLGAANQLAYGGARRVRKIVVSGLVGALLGGVAVFLLGTPPATSTASLTADADLPVVEEGVSRLTILPVLMPTDGDGEGPQLEHTQGPERVDVIDADVDKAGFGDVVEPVVDPAPHPLLPESMRTEADEERVTEDQQCGSEPHGLCSAAQAAVNASMEEATALLSDSPEIAARRARAAARAGADARSKRRFCERLELRRGEGEMGPGESELLASLVKEVCL